MEFLSFDSKFKTQTLLPQEFSDMRVKSLTCRINLLQSPSYDSRSQTMKNFCATVDYFVLVLQMHIRIDHFLQNYKKLTLK